MPFNQIRDITVPQRSLFNKYSTGSGTNFFADKKIDTLSIEAAENISIYDVIGVKNNLAYKVNLQSIDEIEYIGISTQTGVAGSIISFQQNGLIELESLHTAGLYAYYDNSGQLTTTYLNAKVGNQDIIQSIGIFIKDNTLLLSKGMKYIY